MKLEVKETGEKDKPWGLYVDGYLFGYSKSRSDADFAMHLLERASVDSNPSKT
jgi:hypothetical protein